MGVFARKYKLISVVALVVYLLVWARMHRAFFSTSYIAQVGQSYLVNALVPLFCVVLSFAIIVSRSKQVNRVLSCVVFALLVLHLFPHIQNIFHYLLRCVTKGSIHVWGSLINSIFNTILVGIPVLSYLPVALSVWLKRSTWRRDFLIGLVAMWFVGFTYPSLMKLIVEKSDVYAIIVLLSGVSIASIVTLMLCGIGKWWGETKETTDHIKTASFISLMATVAVWAHNFLMLRSYGPGRFSAVDKYALLGAVVICFLLIYREDSRRTKILAIVALVLCILSVFLSKGLLLAPAILCFLVAVSVWLKQLSWWRWVLLGGIAVSALLQLVLTNKLISEGNIELYFSERLVVAYGAGTLVLLVSIAAMLMCGVRRWYGNVGFGSFQHQQMVHKDIVFCPTCGAENEAGSTFCVGCGVKLEQVEQTNTKVKV